MPVLECNQPTCESGDNFQLHAGMQGSSSEAELAPDRGDDKAPAAQPHPHMIPRSVSTPSHQVRLPNSMDPLSDVCTCNTRS